MKLDFLKQKQELVSIALLGLSAFMAVLILYQVADFFAVSARAENVIKTALEQIDTDARDVEQYLAKDRTLAENLTKNNLFIPPTTREHPVKEVRAIFGDQVLVNNSDRWYKEGEMVQDARIVAIEPTHVLIEWDGRQSTFRPIDASIPEPQKSERGTARTAGTSREQAEMVVVGAGTQPTTIQDRTGMRDQRFQDMRQNWFRMSDAERERLRNEMRQRFGGRDFFGSRRGGERGRSRERGE